VLRALHTQLPHAPLAYVADSGHAPYGERSVEYVLDRSRRIAAHLLDQGAAGLVVACNTASAVALPKIREKIGLDVIGVIGPGGRKAVEITKCDKPKIGVIATEATVASGAYARAIERACDNASIVQSACPLFVPLAEEGWTREAETFSIAEKYLASMREFEPDALVLGCTHYPILRDVIQQTVGADVKLIDSGEATAEEVERLLLAKGLMNPRSVQGERTLCDDLDHFYVTDAAERFARVAERFLGTTPSVLEAIEVYGGDQLRQKHER